MPHRRLLLTELGGSESVWKLVRRFFCENFNVRVSSVDLGGSFNPDAQADVNSCAYNANLSMS